MAQTIKFDAEVDLDAITGKINELFDQRTMLAVHNRFAQRVDPWVPFLEGPLSQTIEVTPECVRYVQPYAHYQYYGIGFNHTKDVHPLASAKWGEVAMQTQLEPFKEDIKQILVRRSHELYG